MWLTLSMAPPDMHARLLAVFTTIRFGIQPIATLFVGFTAEHVGVPMAMLINGALLVVFTLALLALQLDSRKWKLARPAAPPAQSAPQPAD